MPTSLDFFRNPPKFLLVMLAGITGGIFLAACGDDPEPATPIPAAATSATQSAVEPKAVSDDSDAVATASGLLDGIAVPNPFDANDDDSVRARYTADKARFEAVLASGSPVLWKTDAVWCGFCVRMRPIMLELMDEYDGRIHVLIMDYDDGELSEYRNRFDATSHPSFAVIGADGAVVQSFHGVTDKADLVSVIEEALAAA